jgi:surface antigen
MFELKGAAIRLLATGTLLALISGCSGHTMSTASTYKRPESAIGIATNLFKHNYYKLDNEAYGKHQACVSTSLQMSAYGNKCDWSTNTTRGQVMVADVYQAGSRICKTLRTSVKDQYGKTFQKTETACGSGNNWTFN